MIYSALAVSSKQLCLSKKWWYWGRVNSWFSIPWMSPFYSTDTNLTQVALRIINFLFALHKSDQVWRQLSFLLIRLWRMSVCCDAYLRALSLLARFCKINAWHANRERFFSLLNILFKELPLCRYSNLRAQVVMFLLYITGLKLTGVSLWENGVPGCFLIHFGGGIAFHLWID